MSPKFHLTVRGNSSDFDIDNNYSIVGREYWGRVMMKDIKGESDDLDHLFTKFHKTCMDGFFDKDRLSFKGAVPQTERLYHRSVRTAGGTLKRPAIRYLGQDVGFSHVSEAQECYDDGQVHV